MTKIMMETTQWADRISPNHIYVFESFKSTDRTARAVAYSAWGTGPVQRFKQPMVLDLRGRTFQVLD
jgi:hypothetical protein